MREIVRGLGFGLIVLVSGAAGGVVGMNLGPLALNAREVAVGCGALAVALAVLVGRSIAARYEGRARRHALMRLVERRMTRLSPSAVRSR